MAKTVTKTAKVFEIVKKIGRTAYWLSLPILLILVIYGQYLQFNQEVLAAANIVRNQAIISAQVEEVCTPRMF